MGHKVTAPLVIVRLKDEQGLMHLYDGQPVPGNADPKDVERLTREGFLSGEADNSAPRPADDEPSGRPAGNGSRDEWAAYAVASGQATEDEVKGLTRDELRGLYS